jgi:hypothetical protein
MRTRSPSPGKSTLRGAAECTAANLELHQRQRIDTTVDDGDVITDDGSLADDDAGGLVREDALADGGGLVDVDGKEVSTRVAAVLLPEDAVGLRRQGSDGERKT